MELSPSDCEGANIPGINRFLRSGKAGVAGSFADFCAVIRYRMKQLMTAVMRSAVFLIQP
jgi:hypothetical protein